MKTRLWLADPPWLYNDRKLERKDNPGKKAKFGIGVERRYSAGTMKTADLAALGPQIQHLSSPDAYMLMWAVMPLLDVAMTVMDAWGYDYITTPFTWVKTTKNGKLFKGPGAYTLSNTEVILLGRRKGAKRLWHSNAKGCYKPCSVVMEPHPRGDDGKIIHSRKPEIFHREIEKWLFPYLGEDMRAVELFATQRREGWTCLGHALTSTMIQDDLQKLISRDAMDEMTRLAQEMGLYDGLVD